MYESLYAAADQAVAIADTAIAAKGGLDLISQDWEQMAALDQAAAYACRAAAVGPKASYYLGLANAHQSLADAALDLA